jgi:signal peptidase I
MSGWRTVFEWTKSIAFAIGIALLIRWPVAEPFKIPSSSMYPTLQINDRLFVNKHAYGVRWPFNGFRIYFTRHTIWYTDKWLWEGPMPERWDIVVFKSVEDRVEHDTLVKRVVGLPGETIHIQDGKIFINGEPLELPPDMPDVYYTVETSSNHYAQWLDEDHAVVPEGHVFLMGDNSSQSRDGRWFGFVPHNHLLGEVTSIWFPVSRWRDFTGYTQTLWWRVGWSLIAIYTLLRLFVGRSVTVYSEGLAGLVAPREKALVRFSLGIPIPFFGMRIGRGRELRRGDVVLYKPPKGADAPELLLGIVAGLPDEKVSIQDGRLEVNGKPVEDGVLAEPHFPPNEFTGKYGINRGKEYSMVPADHVYLLAASDGGAPDSRALGWIPRERVVGTLTRVWWPIQRARKVA